MRISSFLKTRGTTASHARRFSHRPLLEMLEDRLLPSIADGTILVAPLPDQGFSTLDQSSFPRGIIGVNPVTGAQTAVSTGAHFSLPTYICEGPNQQLYVTDLTAFGTGAILQVDPNTGQQTVVAKGGFLNGPNVLAFINGFLYVADEGDATGVIHNIVRIDPNTGQQSLVTDGSSGGFSIPVGMRPAPGNHIYVADEPGNVQGTDPGKIWLINLDTGVQTLVSSNNSAQGTLFNHPVDIALDANGNLIVANTGSAGNSYAGSVFRVNPQTGVQTPITTFGTGTGVDSIEVGLDGTIYVGAISVGSAPAKIYSVNPVTGGQSIVTSGGNLSLVEGIRVFRTTVDPSTTAGTTTEVDSSANPSLSGQTVTFTATVSSDGPGNPTGTVTFFEDSSSIGQGTLSTTGGVTSATFSTASLGAGAHTFTATYSGDTHFNDSTSTALTQTVNQASTSIVVVSAVNASVSGQSVTFTATISSSPPGAGTPTGTVQFLIDGSNAGGPLIVSNAGGETTASFSTATLTVGTHTVTASYSGDDNFAGSTGSLTGGQVVNKANTSTAVTSSAAPSVFGQTVTFTATVTVSGLGSTAVANPTGVVMFSDGATSIGQGILSSAGGTTTARFSTSSLTVGSHTITALYGGDTNFTTSTRTLAQTVGKATSSVVVASAVNPSAFGQGVTFTATVIGTGTPTGVVTFSDGVTSIGQGTLSTAGGATTTSFSTSSLTVGGHTITASYGGDGNFLGSTRTLTQTINQDVTTTSVTSSANQSVSGQTVNFTATVRVQSPGAGTPTGTVQFLIDSSSVGSPVSVSTSGGVTTANFSLASLAVGSHTVTASYSGDTNCTGSTGTLTQVVNQDATVTAVASSASPLVFGQTATFTATVTVSSPGSTAVASPTGVVTFSDGAIRIGQGTLSTSGGTTTANFSTSSLTVGSHTITASYVGDRNFLASTGILNPTVNQGATTTGLTSSANPSAAGQTITFTAVVAVNGPGSTAVASPTGTVNFLDNGNSIGQGTLSSAGGATTASFSISSVTVGIHSIAASYVGDGNFQASTGMLTQTVQQGATTTDVSSSAISSVSGQTVTFTASVRVQSPGVGTPTGTVQFQIDGSNAGSPVSLSTSGGLTTASLSTATLTVGTHTVTATYSGDGSFASSIALLTGDQVVNQANTIVAASSSVTSSVFGQVVTFTATVAVSGPGSTAAANPTGVVTFFDGDTSIGQGTLSTAGGMTAASFMTSNLATGNHTITASYAGDNNFLTSTRTLLQTVGEATTTVSASSASPSASGQTVTFTATVTVNSPGSTAVANPTGVVTFSDGSTRIGEGSLSTADGTTTASFSTSSLTVGSHAITAFYSGDSNFLTSTGTLTQTVHQGATTTSLTSLASPSVSGQTVTFTASVNVQSPAAGTPTGTVHFLIDGSNVGSAVSVSTAGGVTTASFSTATLAVGTHTVAASYSGDSNFAGSTATLAGGEVVNKASTSTAVSTSVMPSVSGQSVTLTATVTVSGPGSTMVASPTGVVTFSDGATNLGEGTLITQGGTATASFTTSNLAVGSHTITAAYAGDRNFLTSTGTLTQAVNQNVTTTSISSSTNLSVSGQTVTFTATVSSMAPGTGTPTGTIEFQIDGSNAGSPVTVNTSAGLTTASFSTASLAVGRHTIKAVYSGDTSRTTSTGVLSQTVNQDATSTGVTSSANLAVSGQLVTLTATVTVSSPGSTAVANPTGVVAFSDGAVSIGQGTLSTSGGTTTASFSTSSLTVGSHTITASYGGDGNYLASTDALIQTVSKASTSTNLLVSAAAVPYNQPVVLTATVSSAPSGSPLETGSIVFLDGGSLLATVPLSGATAAFSTSTLSLGGHSLRAAYVEDASHTASSSSAIVVTVGTPNERFVGQLYASLLRRQPDAGGLADWTAALNRGASRTQVALAIEKSLESRTQQVQALYHQFLHRDVDPSGLNTFVTFLGAGVTLEEVSIILTSSPEYLQVRGGGTKNGFLTALYEDALSRSPDAGGLAAFMQALDQGVSRPQVAAAIFGSTEYLQHLVANFYELFLKRAADDGGLNSFVTALRVGVTDQDVIAAMLGSDEFFARSL
jgi:S-adenosylmethionine/arginine decarboxylase-like enzyme